MSKSWAQKSMVLLALKVEFSTSSPVPWVMFMLPAASEPLVMLPCRVTVAEFSVRAPLVVVREASASTRKVPVPCTLWLKVFAVKSSPMVTLLAARMVTSPTRVTLPTMLLKVMLPVPASRVSPSVPSTMLLKVMSPAPVPVLRVTVLVRFTSPVKSMSALTVVMLAPRLIPAAPSRETAPELIAPTMSTVPPVAVRVTDWG